MRVDAALSLAGPGEDTGWRVNLVWFRALLLMHMAARSVLLMPEDAVGDIGDQLIRWAIIMTAFVGFFPRFSLRATRVAACLLFVEVILGLPFTANHVFLELVLLVFLALLDERDEQEGLLQLQALRWLIAVMFFYTGLQKLLYGCYFDGQFLTYLAATDERFQTVFQYLIPAADMERLVAFNVETIDKHAWTTWAPELGAGPYRVDSVLFVAMSNFVYVFEMLAGILLLVPKTRAWAAGASIVFVLMIEAGAREFVFGMLMVNLLLLFLPGSWIKRCFPAFALVYLYLSLDNQQGIGLLPMFPHAPP